MKYFILLLGMLYFNLAYTQITSNIISKTDYNNISINGKTLSEIKSTEGILNLVQNLYDEEIIEIINDEMINSSSYKYNGLEFGFSGLLGTIDNPILGRLEVFNGNWTVTILGKTIKIRDDISILGNVVFNTNRDGVRSVIYQYCDGCNNYISILIGVDNKVRRITYIEKT